MGIVADRRPRGSLDVLGTLQDRPTRGHRGIRGLLQGPRITDSLGLHDPSTVILMCFPSAQCSPMCSTIQLVCLDIMSTVSVWQHSRQAGKPVQIVPQ
jgi:hypothetical protein